MPNLEILAQHSGDRLAKAKEQYLGKTFSSNNYGDFIIVEYTNSKNIIIEFVKTGYKTKTSMANVVRGLVADKSLPLQRSRKRESKMVGKVLSSNSCGDYTILEYKSKDNILIEFIKTGYKTIITSSRIADGSIKDKLLPRIYNVGIVGNKYPTNTKHYTAWYGMLQRCYDKSLHTKINKTYKNCTVSENFLRYEYFYEWCEKQVGFTDSHFELDKDLLIKGNSVYSENTCVFVPREINIAMIKSTASRGNLFIGVTFDKASNNYRSYVCVGNGKRLDLGCFKTEIEAFNAYKQTKENYLKGLANKWKNHIDIKAYTALMNYQVEITD